MRRFSILHILSILLSVVIMTTVALGEIASKELEKINQAVPSKPRVEPQKSRTVLVFNKSEGYEHESIEYAAKTLEIMGEKTGAFSVVQSSDMNIFNRRWRLRKFDAIIFNNTTQLKFENERARKNLMRFIRRGKGIVGIHAATDNFYDWPEAAEMMGGLFDGHPWTADGTWAVKIVDPDHTLTQAFHGEGFKVSDEIYRIKEPFSRENLRVLVTLDMDDPATKNAEGIQPTDNYVPISWLREYEKGRLFYCSFGHNPHIYWNTAILQHYMDGIQYALGDLQADAVPTLIKNITYLRTYEYGQSRAPLTDMQDFIRKHNSEPEVLHRTEQRLLDILRANGTLAGKQFICQQLRIIGGPESVPVLSDMLSDEETSDMARSALEKIEHPSAGVALRTALKETDGSLKVGIINSLGNRRDVESVNQLQELLETRDVNIYSAALKALAHIGSESAVSALEDAMKVQSGAREREALVAYLRGADHLAKTDQIDQANFMYGSVFNADYPAASRIAALTGLIQTSESPYEVIMDVLKSGEPEMQTVALGLVAELENLRNVEEIAGYFSRLETLQQIQLLSALEERSDPVVLDVVEEATTHENQDVRIAALRALSSLGDAGIVEFLAAHAANSSGDEQEAARESLYNLTGENVNQTILASIMEVDPETRLELIRSIDNRQILTGTEILLLTARNPSTQIRIESIRVLGNVAHPNYLTDMLNFLDSVNNESERNELEKSIIAIASRKPENANQIEEVQNKLSNTRSTIVRSALIRILGNIGAKDGLSSIKQALTSGNSIMELAAIQALSVWPTSEPAPELLNAAENANSNKQLILALRGYVHLLGFDNDDPDVVNKYRKAMELAPNTTEQRMVLSGVADVKSLEAMDMAAEYLNDEALQSEAEVAVVQIGQDIYDEYPERTKELIERVIENSDNESLLEEAGEILDNID